MVDLSLFRIPTMTPSLLAALFQGLANFAVLFLVIMYLQGVRGPEPSTPRSCSSPATWWAAPSAPSPARLADRSGR